MAQPLSGPGFPRDTARSPEECFRPRMKLPLWRIAPLLFCSGVCALVYQVAWLRELRLVFGASTAASAAVLAIFMGGLGAGGLVLGKRADASRNPLLLYANLEIGVSLTAAITPPLVGVVRHLYVAVGGTPALGLGLGTVARLLLAALVLLPPTLLMGGTLPAAARAVETEDDDGRRNLALLYGANTLGAVTGAAASSFLLLEVFGASLMLWIACALNALVGMSARMMSRGAAPAAATGDAAPAETEAEVAPLLPPRFVLVASAIVGFAFLLMELVWYRMLAPLLGGSSYTFGLVLALALLGVGLGGAAYALWMEKRPATAAGLALTCALEALFIAVPYALGDRLAIIALVLRPLGVFGFASLVGGWSVVAAIVILPAAFVSGVQFPMLIALLGRGSRGVGRHVGLAYAWNTAGAIAGSLAGGFGLMPLLGAPGLWRGVVVVLAGLGAATAWLSLRSAPARPLRIAPPLAAAALALLLLRSVGPTAAWRHSGIGAGRARLDVAHSTAAAVEDWARSERRAILWEAEGVESSVAVTSLDGIGFVVNGKVDGHATLDAGTQVMSGLLGALLHPDPKRALVIGLGTGSTAGWLGAVPSMERVDVVELEPAILRVARDCASVNRAVLDNPEVHVVIGDAREVVLTTRDRYDVIFSEPSNPYRAGIASLFTQDFYEAAERRLAPGGIFLQWLQAYEVDGQTVRTALATLGSVFPEVEAWATEPGDLVLMASREPIRYDVPTLRARVAADPFRAALGRTWRVGDLEGVLARHLASAGLVRAVAQQEGAALNTDDRNMLELGFARSVGNDLGFSEIELLTLARARGEDRPTVTGGAVDWDLVEEERAVFEGVAGRMPTPPRGASPDMAKRIRAYAAHFTHDHRGVLAAWRDQPREPRTPFELGMVGQALADAGDDAAIPLLDRLRAIEPAEADALLAVLRVRQHKPAEAATPLEAAFRAYHAEPFARRDVMRTALVDLTLGAGQDRALARRLMDALAEPFAAYMLEDERRDTLLKLASRVDFRGLCAPALARFEPNVPWRRELLAVRRACYAETNGARLAAADADLRAFLRTEATPFFEGLLPPAAPPR